LREPMSFGADAKLPPYSPRKSDFNNAHDVTRGLVSIGFELDRERASTLTKTLQPFGDSHFAFALRARNAHAFKCVAELSMRSEMI
jgi:hypothetical protein